VSSAGSCRLSLAAENTTHQRILRGAIFAELGVAWRYGQELVGAELRAAGVDPEEYGFVSLIGVLQPTTRTEIVAALGMRRTTLRDRLRQFIDSGHIREAPNPDDGRSTLLTLAPKGQRVFDKGHPAFLRALKRLDDALGGELDAHEEVLWRVRVALQELQPE
jgi:DNA-binding MarR family transcriptional regulator